MRCLALLLAMTAAAPAAGPEPRYRLEVGRELTYTGSALYEGENARFTESQIWTVWVLRQNPDGSVRLLVQNENRLTPEDRKGVPLDESTTDSSLAYVDLFADGRSAWNPTMGLMLDPVRLFPPPFRAMPTTSARGGRGPSPMASSGPTSPPPTPARPPCMPPPGPRPGTRSTASLGRRP